MIGIIGAGPGGLVAALAARSLGLDATVYERSEDFGPVEGTWMLNPNGRRVLDTLRVPLHGMAFDVRSATLEDQSGAVLYRLDYDDIPMPHAAAIVGRRQLLETLLQTARERGVRIHMGHTLNHLRLTDGGVHLDLKPSAAAHVSVLIGADGKHSTVRSAVGIRAACHHLGRAYLRGCSRQPPRHPYSREIWGTDGRRFGFDPTADGTTGFYCTAPRDGQPTPQWMADWEGSAGKEAVAILEAVEDWSRPQYEEPYHVVCHRWSVPPVFLIGDAAHAQAPNLSQGANAAMVDALILMRLLAAGRAHEYEQVRRDFVTATQSYALLVDRLSSWTWPPARRARDAAIQLAAHLPWVRGQALRAVAGYHAAEARYYQS